MRSSRQATSGTRAILVPAVGLSQARSTDPSCEEALETIFDTIINNKNIFVV
jgi:hypothetical protein